MVVNHTFRVPRRRFDNTAFSREYSSRPKTIYGDYGYDAP